MDVDDLWYRQDGTPKARCGKGRRWQARWREPGGKQKAQAFDRKLDAERHVGKVVTDKARGTYIDPAAGKTLLRDFATDWQAGLTCGLSTQAKIGGYLRNHMLPGLGDRQLGQIRPSVVSAWTAGLLRKGLADGTVREMRGCLSTILTAAVEDGLIASNPCRARSARMSKRSQRKIVPWTAERIGAMADCIAADLRALVETGAGEGLREGELLGLAPDDVDFLRRVIHVRRQVKMLSSRVVYSLPKGGKTRDVPLSDSVGLALARHIGLYPPVRMTLPWEAPDGKPRTVKLLFTEKLPDGRCQAWRRNRFERKAWHPALKAAGIEWEAGAGDGCHALRHFAASFWLADGCSVNEVAEYLGHADASTTLRIYAHLMPSAPDRMRAAADRALAAARGPAAEAASS